jgi:hypothetical protein
MPLILAWEGMPPNLTSQKNQFRAGSPAVAGHAAAIRLHLRSPHLGQSLVILSR